MPANRTSLKTKERPLILSAREVVATLNREQTRFRRVMPVQPPADVLRIEPWIVDGELQSRKSGMPLFVSDNGKGEHREYGCPFGKPGDHLWIQETHGYFGAGGSHLAYRATLPEGWPDWPNTSTKEEDILDRWLHPTHLPRRFSRILLEVAAIRAERLQQMTEEDARAEGITTVWPLNPDAGHYVKFWNSVYGKKAGCDWDSNPWVYVTEFNLLKGGTDA